MDSYRDSKEEAGHQKNKSFNIITTSVIVDLGLDVSGDVEEEDKSTFDQLSAEEELNPTIEQFTEDRDYYLCCVGFFIGIENIMRFPYICYANGGGVFLIPYLTALCVIVIPMFTIETAWGQLVRCRLDHKFSAIHPGLWGFSAAVILLLSTTIPFYSTLFPWIMSFLVASFENPLPWNTGDVGTWNRDYFPEVLLQKTSSINEIGGLVPRLVILLFVACAILFFTMRKGLKSSSSAMNYTATIPYFIMFVFFIKGVTLEGSWIGLRYLFVPDLSKLFDLSLWMNGIL